jgi:hypothetical protein
METLVTGLVIGLTLAFILYLFGSSRNAGEATASKPDDVTSFMTPTPKSDVLRAVILFAQMSGLNVESLDESQGKIVLGEDLNLMKNHNGYWLLVYVSESNNGVTTVEVGIKSKAFQAGFLLRSIRDKAANNINAAIIVNRGSTNTPVIQQPTPPVPPQPTQPPQPTVKITMTRKP